MKCAQCERAKATMFVDWKGLAAVLCDNCVYTFIARHPDLLFYLRDLETVRNKDGQHCTAEG